MKPKVPADPQVTPLQPQHRILLRDPEDRVVPLTSACVRDKMLDKTIADTFPTSDPPSSLPDPSADDSFATEEERRLERELCQDSKTVA